MHVTYVLVGQIESQINECCAALSFVSFCEKKKIEYWITLFKENVILVIKGAYFLNTRIYIYTHKYIALIFSEHVILSEQIVGFIR